MITELHKVFKLEYRPYRIYEVWHFIQTRPDLFQFYVDSFFKIKQETSELPYHCQTNERKQDKMGDIRQLEGITMYL